MERIKNPKSIDKIFAAYIICFSVVTIFIVVFIAVIFQISMSLGSILPANYYEQLIEQRRSEISKAEDVKALIPDRCNYVVYNLEGKTLQGNTSDDKAIDIWKMIQDNETSSGSYFYKVIQRENEICVVEYTLVSSFSNDTLNKYVPNAMIIFILLFSILFISEVIIFSRLFRIKLAKEMKILKDTTENIKMENLDFQTGYSNISEINEVLSAISKMKKELHLSLNKQWKMEENRKEQIAAVAHDIKTPLTIVRGNAELLDETDLDSNQSVFNKRILSEINNMEAYLKSIAEIMKSERETILKKEQISLSDFIDDIVEKVISMSLSKRLEFISEIKDIPKDFIADKIALQRAIINVISNAVDYCPIEGKILFSVEINDKSIGFIIEDSGRGFTREELLLATEQFFQGDKSRSSKNHYGMGLYIAKNFVNQHGGSIFLQNSERLGGAKVILEVP